MISNAVLHGSNKVPEQSSHTNVRKITQKVQVEHLIHAGLYTVRTYKSLQPCWIVSVAQLLYPIKVFRKQCYSQANETN